MNEISPEMGMVGRTTVPSACGDGWTMSSTAIRPREVEDRFAHDALFYAGMDDFVAQTIPFIVQGVEAGEPILVVVSSEKIARLRAELNGRADRVRFANMVGVGQNPARIIPAWRAFVSEQRATGRPFRGIGEPIWAARSRTELDECERHEALLNVAFDGAPAWRLTCPYDTETLSAPVLEEAERNHPFLVHQGIRRPSGGYRGLEGAAAPFDRPLAAPPPTARQLRFEPTALSLHTLRAVVTEEAAGFGLPPSRTDDLVLAASEVATNSIRHGGGTGVLRLWGQADALVCEISDAGRIEDPLAGRDRPAGDLESGYGLWLANHVCDLVQIRTFESGSVVRLHVGR
jgi:anti-sigma regulatory factor (Ser/Thr protein kinase)